jgi:hypothetical protein
MRMLRHAIGMLRRPAETFDQIKEERLRRSLLYLLVLVLPAAALLLILSLIVVPLFIAPQLGDQQHVALVGIGLMVVSVLAGVFVAVLLAGLVLHLFVRLLGGKQGLRRTIRAVVYASTPLVLLLWLPPAFVATPLWSAALVAVGLQRLQEITIVRAVIALVLPLLVLMGLAAAAGLVLW